ncbi:MAG: hypothetical protein JOZ24_10950 [Candidatus Eremiobacteraeota bacterium]|nr:hypothetical protein [Candidatus Eremiobacteraeota bacterium]
MTPTSDRDAATELARRIKQEHLDPSQVDEVNRPAEDRPPGYADVLMAEGNPVPKKETRGIGSADWTLIHQALEHYASCGRG